MIHNLEDKDTGSPAAMAMANFWLRKCIQNHFHCNRRLSVNYSPKRVLDLRGVDNGRGIRLIQDVQLDGPYVALSHRWGLDGLPVTTIANLHVRLKEVLPSDLSPTMRDAIATVRSLHIQYLWIDALCIIQDSKEDWFQEAATMSNIFSNSILTIAAANGANHHEGIFRERPQCVRPFQLPYTEDTPYRERTHFDGEGEYYCFPKSKFVGSGNRTKGTLDTRCWILQEQILSPRILYFGKGELFWDCVTLSASESSPISASLLYDADPDETWALKLLRKTLAKSINAESLRKRISDVWCQVIKNYSARELTKPTDKLIALEGILKPLAALLGVEPVAGMWTDQLWKQLIWWTSKPSPKKPSNSQGDKENAFSAPSWSWLAAHTPLHYHNSLSSDGNNKSGSSDASFSAHKFTDLDLCAEIISAKSSLVEGASTITGHLVISGPSFPYRLTKNDLKKTIHKRWNAASLKLNVGNWLLDYQLKLPLAIHCVIIAEDAVAKVLICLCLVPDEFMESQWKRVGLCHWDGLAWQVSKYIGRDAETRTFTIN